MNVDPFDHLLKDEIKLLVSNVKDSNEYYYDVLLGDVLPVNIERVE